MHIFLLDMLMKLQILFSIRVQVIQVFSIVNHTATANNSIVTKQVFAATSIWVIMFIALYWSASIIIYTVELVVSRTDFSKASLLTSFRTLARFKILISFFII